MLPVMKTLGTFAVALLSSAAVAAHPGGHEGLPPEALPAHFASSPSHLWPFLGALAVAVLAVAVVVLRARSRRARGARG